MAGIGNLADWSDSGGALPCDLMDSLDDMGVPTSLDAPLPNGLLRAPSITSDVAAGDLDYLCQMGGARWGDWGASVDESSIPLSPPASLPVRPAVTSPSSASTSGMESANTEQPHDGTKAAKAGIAAVDAQRGDAIMAETTGEKEGKENRRALQAGKGVPARSEAASAASVNPLTVTGPRSTRGLRGAAAAAARGGGTGAVNSDAGEEAPVGASRSAGASSSHSGRSSRGRNGSGQAGSKGGATGSKEGEFRGMPYSARTPLSRPSLFTYLSTSQLSTILHCSTPKT